MTDDTKKPEPAQEMVRAAHIEKFLSYSITAEGRAVMVFQIPGNEKFGITLELSALKAFRTTVSDIIAAVEKRQLHPGMSAIHRPQNVTVGHNDTMRGVALLIFNPDQDDEAMFGLPDVIALGVAEALEKDVFGRMTEQDRRKHMASKSRLLQPPKPKIILPGMGGS